jgi:sugar phosphate isomerase/epimerase
MKIGFLTAPYADISLDEVLDLLRERFPKLDCIEIGVSYYGVAHCDPPLYIEKASRREEFESKITGAGFTLSSLSAHGNPLHPDPEVADTSAERLRHAIGLMSKLDGCLLRDAGGKPVRVVNCFSGLPAADLKAGKGGGTEQKGAVPGWHVCPWPDEHFDANQEQMKFAGAFWRECAEEARDAGVELAFELHPNFLAHNPETYLELIDRAGDDGTTLGLNFDPSHFFWRNMDPIAMIRYLGRKLGKNPVKHCHGKDTYADPYNYRVNGNHSTTPYSREADRVWRFVTIGEGWDPVNGAHDFNWWARFITELQLWGYDHVISIEHEDSRKSFGEGLGKALRVLDLAVNRETPGPMTWAER